MRAIQRNSGLPSGRLPLLCNVVISLSHDLEFVSVPARLHVRFLFLYSSGMFGARQTTRASWSLVRSVRWCLRGELCFLAACSNLLWPTNTRHDLVRARRTDCIEASKIDLRTKRDDDGPPTEGSTD